VGDGVAEVVGIAGQGKDRTGACGDGLREVLAWRGFHPSLGAQGQSALGGILAHGAQHAGILCGGFAPGVVPLLEQQDAVCGRKMPGHAASS
jgi:hypothetical protein